MPEPPEPEPGAGAGDPDLALDDGERALLEGFDRLAPVGTLRWGFDDSMARLADATPPTTVPWPGLPDDLWERGRSARIGRRFVGDVAVVLAETLATDARSAADAVSARLDERLGAAWDALRYVAARLERLERRAEPLAAFQLDVHPRATAPRPDLAHWAATLDDWLEPDALPPGAVLVGESGDGTLVAALARQGRSVVGVDPSGDAVWRSSQSLPPSARTVFGDVPAVLAEVEDHSLAAVVLVGWVDHQAVADDCEVVAEAARRTAPGGAVAVVATSQDVWDASLAPPARDLLPGRPLHPDTWCLLFERAGLADVTAYGRPDGGAHVVVGRVR
ncbi:MAG: class I SAM-dependent methyltransferase [Acidimicrobiales bacterium]